MGLLDRLMGSTDGSTGDESVRTLLDCSSTSNIYVTLYAVALSMRDRRCATAMCKEALVGHMHAQLLAMRIVSRILARKGAQASGEPGELGG